ncbi:MAG: hypothetical protein LAO79_27740 [Acidobacteriia bacterium]|nr:hypothetical protein [Terriglobia bacterium]
MAARWMKWMLPNLAMLVSIAAIAYCAGFFQAPSRFFSDADPGWHIRTGDWIRAHHAVPRDDLFSFEQTGQPWFAWEWLADVLMSTTHSFLGLTGIVWMYTLVLGAATWTWFRLQWETGGNFLIACLMVSPLLASTQIHWLARPHMLTFVLFPLLLLCLESMPAKFEPKHAALAVAGGALWANLHGSFPLAIAIAACYGRKYFALAACMLAGTFLNPYGWHLHWHVIDYLILHPELHANVTEWQKFDFATNYSRIQVGLMFAFAAMGAVAAAFEHRLRHTMIIALVLAAAWSAQRGVPVAALVALPLANGAITTFLRSRKRLRNFIQIGDEFREIDNGFNGAALAPIAAILMLVWLRSPAVAARTGFLEPNYPVSAAAAIPPAARVFASPEDAGYLIYLDPSRRITWVDSRTDYFGAGRYRTYLQILNAAPGWQDAFDRLRFSHVLIRRDSGLARALPARGWRAAYSDETYILLAP